MLTYEIQGNMVAVTGCNSKEDIVVIPEKIEGLPVMKIASSAFSMDNNIKSVSIPGCVKVIESFAFASCKKLAKVTIEEGLEAIEDWAFISCPIKELELPKSLKQIGPNAFLGTTHKEMIDDLIKSHDINQSVSSKLNNRCCLLPYEFKDNLNLITHQFINKFAKYTNNQFMKYVSHDLEMDDMDLPFIFDNDDLIVTFYTKDEIENIEVRVSDESKRLIGEYDTDNKDFMVLSADLMDGEKILSSFIFKAPFLEDLSFKLLQISSKKSKDYKYYVIILKADMKCYGNGNPDRMFALNQFDEITKKYEACLKHKLIDKSDLEKFNRRVDEEKLKLLKEFINEIKGSPLLTYTNKLYGGVLHDDDLTNKRLSDYARDRLKEIYVSLGDFNSFMKLAFDLDDALCELIDSLNIPLEDLNKRYGICICDADGNQISAREAKSYKKKFIDVEDNYKLHAKYLNLVYQRMSKLNVEFILDKYLTKKE